MQGSLRIAAGSTVGSATIVQSVFLSNGGLERAHHRHDVRTGIVHASTRSKIRSHPLDVRQCLSICNMVADHLLRGNFDRHGRHTPLTRPSSSCRTIGGT